MTCLRRAGKAASGGPQKRLLVDDILAEFKLPDEEDEGDVQARLGSQTTKGCGRADSRPFASA